MLRSLDTVLYDGKNDRQFIWWEYLSKLKELGQLKGLT